MINPGKKSERCTKRSKLVLLKIFLGFPYGSASEESACDVRNWGSRSPEEGKGYPLQYSCLENSTGCIVHGVTKSRT